ncbi:MAG: TraR/DksA family transcriptional regulator [Kiritimatiellaceae bacterium]|nr:TraR/DksA family transcriptional regulator [Kiritimatiellaceae bacterium]
MAVKKVKVDAEEKAVKAAPAKTVSVKKETAKKVVEKPVASKPSVKVKPTPSVVPVMTRTVAPALAAQETKKLTAQEIVELKDLLLTLRERVSGEFHTLSRDNLDANQRDASLSDQGTDTFDREMELNMMGSEQEVLFEIDAALRRIEKGTYGICELTGLPINIERLQALPYVRYTVRAQSELEKGRARFRPFGGTMRG